MPLTQGKQFGNKLKSDRLLYKATALDEPAHPSAGNLPTRVSAFLLLAKIVERFETPKLRMRYGAKKTALFHNRAV